MMIVSKKHQSGFTLLELLITLLLSSILFLMASSQYAMVTRNAVDNRVESTTKEMVQIILDQIAFDVSMTGAGMPLGQTDFKMSDAGIGEEALPILLDSDNTQLSIRIPARGRKTLLTSTMTVGASMYFNVADASDFDTNDIVYLNNAGGGGEQGLYAEIASIAGNQITLDAGTVEPYIAGTSFPTGTMVSPVRTVSYFIDADGDLIRSDNVNGDVPLAPLSNLSFTYYAEDGSEITTSLNQTNVANSLASIDIEVEVELPERDGTTEVFSATKRVPLLNMINARR